jgi:transcriptional regulator with XRE-family HTH domain
VKFSKTNEEEAEIIRQGIGNALRDAVWQTGMSQEAFGLHCGRHKNTISNTVTGRHLPSRSTAKAIAKGLIDLGLDEDVDVWVQRRNDTAAARTQHRRRAWLPVLLQRPPARIHSTETVEATTGAVGSDLIVYRPGMRTRLPVWIRRPGPGAGPLLALVELVLVLAAIVAMLYAVGINLPPHVGGSPPPAAGASSPAAGGPPPAIIGVIVETTDGVFTYPRADTNEGRRNGPLPGQLVNVVCTRTGREAADFDRLAGIVKSRGWYGIDVGSEIRYVSDLFVQLPPGTRLPACQ